MVKRAPSLFNSFCSSVAKQVVRFLLHVFPYLSRIPLQWANIKKWGRGSGGQFHTNHCILSTRASSWCLCLQECGKGYWKFTSLKHVKLILLNALKIVKCKILQVFFFSVITWKWWNGGAVKSKWRFVPSPVYEKVSYWRHAEYKKLFNITTLFKSTKVNFQGEI